MAFKSSRWNQYPGIPGLVYKEWSDYGRYNMSLEECRKCLHKIYAALRASLPMKELATNEDLGMVQGLLNGIPEKNKTLHELIPQNEADGTIIVPEDLMKIRLTLDGELEALTDIITTTKLLDYVRQELGTMPKADE